MKPSCLTHEEIMDLLPQKKPFRFVDKIIEVDENHIVSEYTFRSDEYFYAGHFPSKPITPGVILLEAMAQTGVCLLGIYLLSTEHQKKEDFPTYLTIFADAQVEFLLPVLPGDKVIMRAEKVFWRHKKLKSKVEMFHADGRLAASSVVAGMGVLQ